MKQVRRVSVIGCDTGPEKVRLAALVVGHIALIRFPRLVFFLFTSGRVRQATGYSQEPGEITRRKRICRIKELAGQRDHFCGCIA